MIGIFRALFKDPFCLWKHTQPLIPNRGGRGGPNGYRTFPMCFLQVAEKRTSQGLDVSRSPKGKPQEEAHWKSEQQRWVG